MTHHAYMYSVFRPRTVGFMFRGGKILNDYANLQLIIHYSLLQPIILVAQNSIKD